MVGAGAGASVCVYGWVRRYDKIYSASRRWVYVKRIAVEDALEGSLLFQAEAIGLKNGRARELSIVLT